MRGYKLLKCWQNTKHTQQSLPYEKLSILNTQCLQCLHTATHSKYNNNKPNWNSDTRTPMKHPTRSRSYKISPPPPQKWMYSEINWKLLNQTIGKREEDEEGKEEEKHALFDVKCFKWNICE